jgi:hypothetical protein
MNKEGNSSVHAACARAGPAGAGGQVASIRWGLVGPGTSARVVPSTASRGCFFNLGAFGLSRHWGGIGITLEGGHLTRIKATQSVKKLINLELNYRSRP